MSPIRHRNASMARLALALALSAAIAAGADGNAQRATGAPPPTQSSADALTAEHAREEFQQKLDAYLALRKKLANRLKPLESTTDAAELTARQASLAAAIKEARRDAQKGDLIPARMAEEIRTIVLDDYRNRPADARAATAAEVPERIPVRINQSYPQEAALPTVPPLLLARLPVLPDNLQYRFANRHVVILDGDTHIVIDYIADVLPPS